MALGWVDDDIEVPASLQYLLYPAQQFLFGGCVYDAVINV